MMNKGHFSATTLRLLLLVGVVLSSVVIVGGFYYAQNWLSEHAIKSKTNDYQSVSGSLNTNDLDILQADIYSHQAASIKATGLLSSKQNPEKSIKTDLNRYASKIGITITSLSPSQAPSVEASIPSINGVRSQYFSVTLENPIEFTKLYEFIQAIETNIPKMRITGISIDGNTSKNGYVNVKPIIIGVYTR